MAICYPQLATIILCFFFYFSTGSATASSTARQVAVLEMKALSAGQRADLCDQRLQQVKNSNTQLELRNAQLEKQFEEVRDARGLLVQLGRGAGKRKKERKKERKKGKGRFSEGNSGFFFVLFVTY